MPQKLQMGGADASGQMLPVRSGEDVLSLPMEKVDYIGVSPQQIVGISAALVPFLEHEGRKPRINGCQPPTPSRTACTPRSTPCRDGHGRTRSAIFWRTDHC